MPITVVIVEDHPEIRDSWMQLINDAPGFSCLCACDCAEDALRVIPKIEPNVVLMDINLPNMSGIECTARLKHLMPAVQVLMLTVYEDGEKIFKALKAGASGYLLKRTT